MRQALHIFKKDVRYLRYEIAVTLALVAMFAVVEIQGSKHNVSNLLDAILLVILPIYWAYLAARVIYAEPLRGDRLFWITRPYAWKSLLAAKVLFMLVFVNLPILLAHAIILSANGFPVLENLLGLLWNQVLVISLIVLPVVAMATVTTGFVQLFLTALIFFVLLTLNLVSGAAWQGLAWIRTSLVIGTVAFAGLVMVLWQYSRRRAAIACGVALVAIALVLVASALFPWTHAFVLQSWLSKRTIDVSMVHIALDRDRAPRVASRGIPFVEVQLPIQITGLPDGSEVRADNVSLTAEGFRWITRIIPAYLLHEAAGFQQVFDIDRGSYERLKDQPVTLRTSFYLTLLGNPKTTTVQQGVPVAVPGVGRCAILAKAPALSCRNAFGDLLDSVSLQWEPGQSFMVARPISYSPYPTQFRVSPIYQHIHVLSGSPSRIVIVSEEPFMHFRMDAEFHDVRLHLSE